MHRIVGGILFVLTMAELTGGGEVLAAQIMTPLERVAITPKGQLKSPYPDFACRRPPPEVMLRASTHRPIPNASLGEKRTWRGLVSMSSNDPMRTFRSDVTQRKVAFNRGVSDGRLVPQSSYTVDGLGYLCGLIRHRCLRLSCGGLARSG